MDRNKEVFGMAIDNAREFTFEVFSFGLHNHAVGDDTDCEFRSGLYLTVMNLRFSIGMFRL